MSSGIFFKHSFGRHLFSVFINLGEVVHISGILELLDHSLNILFFCTYFIHYLFSSVLSLRTPPQYYLPIIILFFSDADMLCLQKIIIDL